MTTSGGITVTIDAETIVKGICLKLIHYVLVIVVLSVLSACSEKATWYGAYSYEAMLGDNVADDAVKNIYDVAVYTPGGTLFSLRYEDDQLLTTWDGLIPDESLPKKGIYFSKN